MIIELKSRLGLMMFLQYFVWGAWYVTLGTWLASALHFSGQQIAWTAGTTSIGAIISPFFVGLIADRWFATQKLLGVLHLAGAVILLQSSRQASFGPLYWGILVYSLCYMPTLALTNSLAFRQMQQPQLEFGPIRVFGTIGWIVAGLLVGHLGIEATAIPMRLAAACSLVLGLYCFTLPMTSPLAGATEFKLGQIIPMEAIQLFRGRSMAVFALASFLICIPLQFYYAFTNLYLNEIGVHNAAGKMTGGQLSELVCMLLIPWFFRRLGVKTMLSVGMLAWALRYFLFARGDAGTLVWMIYAGILLHGICYDFFFVVGQIYIDREAPAALRAATQGLITLLTYGAGMLVGSWASGWVVDRYAEQPGASGGPSHDWAAIWTVAGGASALVLVLFLFTFQQMRGNGSSSNSSSQRWPPKAVSRTTCGAPARTSPIKAAWGATIRSAASAASADSGATTATIRPSQAR
jgi:nucleoside transporter